MNRIPPHARRTALTATLMAALAALAVPSLHAQTTYTWTNVANGTGGWSNAANWDANGVPVSAADSIIQFFDDGTSGSASFTATNDLGASFDLQTLVLNGTGSSRTITLGGNSLDFTGATGNLITYDAESSLKYTIENDINFSNGLTINGTGNAQDFNIDGKLTGNGGLTISGSSRVKLTGTRTFSGGLTVEGGRLTLNSGGSHTGGTTLNGGTLVVGHNSSLGSSASTLTLNGGLLTYTNTFGGTATRTRTIGNTVVIGGNVQFGDTNIQGGGYLTLTGSVNLNGGTHSLAAYRSHADDSTQKSVTLSGVVSNGGIVKSGTGSLTLSNSGNTYSGQTIVRQGTLLVGANAGSGVNGALGNATSAIELGDDGSDDHESASLQRIQLLIDGNHTVDRTINVNANNTLGTTVIGGSNTTGIASFTNTVTLNRGVILAAQSGGKTRFGGLIDDGAGSHGVTIGNYTFGSTNTGGGVVVLDHATGNTYDGGTTVEVGSLIVNNTSGSGTGTGAVTVNAGATFGGTGSSSGDITLAAGARLSPGDMDEAGVSSVGTFTGGSSLTWNSDDSTAGMFFNLGVDQASSDLLEISGAFTKGTGSTFVFDFTGSTINESFTYTLLTFGSNNGFTADDFSAINGGAGDFFFSGNSLLYGSAIPEPSTYAAFAGVLAFAGAVWRKRRAARR